jgi:hypothetical protein
MFVKHVTRTVPPYCPSKCLCLNNSLTHSLKHTHMRLEIVKVKVAPVKNSKVQITGSHSIWIYQDHPHQLSIS